MAPLPVGVPKRLNAAAWPALVLAGHARPYERAGLANGIVHLGAGAFFRAHVATYTDAVLASGDRRWGITGVSLRHSDVRDALAPQDGLYTLLERDNDKLSAQVIGALTQVLAASGKREGLQRALCAPSVALVTLTITEKAYGIGADGHLDVHAPAIEADLQNPHAPGSAVGWLTATLVARRQAQVPPYAVLACDNLRDNGHTLRRLVLDYAQRTFPHVASWLADAVAFPNTMVDRIVPRTIAQDRLDAQAAHGYVDELPVRCEPFTQWVIEDFAGARPEWEIAGAQFVADVRPFEDAKLRLLNAAHTAFACFGVLLGHATIAQAATDPDIAAFVRRLMTEELAPTLMRAPALDPVAYQARLWPRFGNAALGHGTQQVAMDTSAKLAQRHVPVMFERRARGEGIECIAVVVAGWIRYLAGRDESGSTYPIDDPLAAPLTELATAWRTDPRASVERFFALETVFGELRNDKLAQDAVVRQLERIAANGVRAALRGT
ncbi:MAG TPA: mannitol dehydrogenase family protein [Burkholderiaceae bacterium]|nr:mannitol dehydrogenase family protein [Burkholderiaceae bacterium]